MGFVLKYFNFFTKPFKWAYNVFPGLQEGASKWVQSIIFYIAVGATVFTVCKLPMVPTWAEVLVAISSALLLSFLTVVRTRVSVSEQDIKLVLEQKDNLKRELENERIKAVKDVNLILEQKDELKKELEKERITVVKLKEDMRNQSTQFLDMNWIWEVNLAQVRLERIKLFDYFVRGKEAPVPWSERPERPLENDKRAIGALKLNYTAKIGIDLKQVLVHYDRENSLVQYWIPEPQQTGALDPSSDWAIRTAMDYTSGKGLMDINLDWRWHDEEAKLSALPIWENEKTERYKDAFASQALSDQLGAAIRSEAEGRLKGFFETLLGCNAVAVPKEQLTQSSTLGIQLPNLMKEKTVFENTSQEKPTSTTAA